MAARSCREPFTFSVNLSPFFFFFLDIFFFYTPCTPLPVSLSLGLVMYGFFFFFFYILSYNTVRMLTRASAATGPRWEPPPSNRALPRRPNETRGPARRRRRRRHKSSSLLTRIVSPPLPPPPEQRGAAYSLARSSALPVSRTSSSTRPLPDAR